MANGTIVYEGISQLDGEPIVAIATWKSKNRKTGDMIQTWILRQDIHPSEALKTGEDSSVCGNCPRRPLIAKQKGLKPCYVKVFNAPRAVWKAYTEGKYGRMEDSVDSVPDIPVRLGSYGDPCAVPIEYWRRLIAIHNQSHTGYTHQWRDERFQEYKTLLMSSCDTLMEAIKADKLGWRSFNVVKTLNPGAGKVIRLAQCPAAAESGNIKTCATCLACNGTKSESDRRASIKILAH